MANFNLQFDVEELSPLQLLNADIPDHLLPNYGQNVAVPVSNKAQLMQNEMGQAEDQNYELHELENSEQFEVVNENQKNDAQAHDECDDDDGRWRKATKKRVE